MQVRSLRAEREGRADRDRLLAAPVVERAGHLALLVEGEAALLGGAHHRHEPEKARSIRPLQVHAGEIAYTLAREHASVAWLHLSALRVGPSFGISSGRPACRRFGISSATPRDEEARVPPLLLYV